MNKKIITFLLSVLFICGCNGYKPDTIARNEYGKSLGELFDTVSWASYGSKAEFKGRVKKGLVFKIARVSEDNFTDEDGLKFFKSRYFVTELVGYFGEDIVYHLFTMDNCALYADLFNGCSTHHDSLNSHTLDDTFKFINSKKNPAEIRKIVLFVMKESERRTYRPGAIVTVVFDVADKRNVEIESIFCPTFPHDADKILANIIEELKAPL